MFPIPGPLHQNQILSNLDQCRMYDAWLALHREGRTMVRLEPGKLVDLVVLDRDYFAVPDAEIKKIRSLLTIVNGKVVHNVGLA